MFDGYDFLMVDEDEARKHQIGIDVVEALKSRLTKEHGKFTGNLQSSIRYRIDGDDIIISMEDYAQYLEFGTPNPTTPEEILDWVKAKIMPTVKITGKNKEAQAERIAKNLAKHITKYGPIPFPFIRQTINEDLPGIIEAAG